MEYSKKFYIKVVVTVFALVLMLNAIPSVEAYEGTHITNCIAKDSTYIDNEWLCLKSNSNADYGAPSVSVGKTCLMKENGMFPNLGNKKDTFKTYHNEFNNWYSDQPKTNDLKNERGAKSTKEALAAMWSLTFGKGSVACTTSYDELVSTIAKRTNSDDDNYFWSDGEEKDIIDTIGPDFPLMLSCGGGFNNEYVVQDVTIDGSTTLDVYLCKGGKWYYNEQITSSFDDDSDGVPQPSNKLVFDCNDKDSTVGSDLSIFSWYDSGSVVGQICGDGIDNLCRSPEEYGFSSDTKTIYESEVIEYYGHFEEWQEKYQTPMTPEEDDCHQNPIACEMNCLWSGNECDYLTVQQDISDACTQTSSDEEGAEDSLECPDNDDFETQPGFCCGAGLVSTSGGHLGDIQSWAGAEFACLNQELVPQDIQGAQEDSCPGDWCWIRSDTNPFKIFTINILGKEAYDIVSESDEEGWLECSEDNVGPYNVDVDHARPDEANRLYCVQEADHYAWAECVYEKGASEDDGGEATGINNLHSVKLREIGDGTFALPIEKLSDNTWRSDLRTQSEGVSESYEEIYTIVEQQPQTLDFTGYDYLEFFVRYTNDNLILPENIQMIVKGIPQDSETQAEVTYFDNLVLGYAVNAPQLTPENSLGPETPWIHVRVPVASWQDVSDITFTSFQFDNEIEIQNIYLSVADDLSTEFDESAQAICSGVDSTRRNNWLSDLDESDSETGVKGENICIRRYGENAWIGNSVGDIEVNPAISSASCCGNAENEYYADMSLRNQYGCFNSEPIAPSQTAMTIEYGVESQIQEHEITFEDYEVSIDVSSTTQLLEDFVWECENYDAIATFTYNTCDTVTSCIRSDDRYITYSPEQSCSSTGSYYDNEDNCKDRTTTKKFTCDQTNIAHDEYLGEVSGLEQITPGNIGYFEEEYYIGVAYFTLGDSYTLNYNDGSELIASKTINLRSFVSEGEEIDIELSYCDALAPAYERDCDRQFEDVEVYFFTPHNQKEYNDKFPLSLDEDLPSRFQLQVRANVKSVSSETSTLPQTTTHSYPCLEDECTFALPGIAPYKITNSYPDLYEMYYLGVVDGTFQEVLITNDEDQEFQETGALKVTKISQQILYEYSDEDDLGSFYGCNAVYYLDELTDDLGSQILEENYGYCAVQGDYYCAYSDDNYLITTWSDQGISKIGFAEVEEFTYNETVLELEDQSFTASQRNHSTNATPGQNIVSNVDFFQKEGSDVFFWELLDESKEKVTDEFRYVDDEIFTIPNSPATFTLRSDKIAIPSFTYLSYSDSSSCQDEGKISITLVDKDGNPTVVDQSLFAYFETANNVYAKIEVQGDCEYEYPYLQIVDEFGASNQDQTESYDTEFTERKGAACCPEGMCWNGYVCASDMSVNTYMAQDTGKESMYRCIEGDWTALEPQYDWNNEEFGFCESSTQCFVTSSLSQGANPDANPADFYNGDFPTCINSGEYLLDHYCDAGEWTSRTKFVASKLIDFAQSEDYILYCSPFDETFINYQEDGYNYANYVAGGVSTQLSQTDSLEASLTGSAATGSTTQVCFDALENSETGRRLVSQEENTCINAVCVLKYKSGDGYAAAFGASMNAQKESEDSFLIPLGVSASQLDSYCEVPDAESEDKFVSCSQELWYGEDIGSLIYAKGGIDISPSIVDRILDWFSGLFGSTSAEDSEEFLSEASNFNRLYLASVGKYDVRAVQETKGDQDTIVAEYDGFQSPICDFINNVNEEYLYEFQWPAQPKELVNCELTSSGVYKVMTASSPEFWWSELTANLRIESNN